MEDKRRLQEIEAAAIGRKGGEAGRSKGPGDPTGRAAVRLAMDDERAELRRRVEAVDRALAWVPLELHKPVAGHILAIAEAVYFRRRATLYGYAAKAGVSEKTAQRWNKMLLQRVDEEIKKAPMR